MQPNAFPPSDGQSRVVPARSGGSGDAPAPDQAVPGAPGREWGESPTALLPARPSLALLRWSWLLGGHLFTGLAVLGAVLPLLPATPFLLLASYCYARSSPRFHRWLVQSRLFGPLLRDWQQHRGIRPHVKVTALSAVLLTVIATVLAASLSPLALAGFLAAAMTGTVVVLRIPTIR